MIGNTIPGFLITKPLAIASCALRSPMRRNSYHFIASGQASLPMSFRTARRRFSHSVTPE